MRTDRYRLYVWVDRRNHNKVDAIELYDHETDPQENQNIARRAAQSAVVEKLVAQWKQGWQGGRRESQGNP